MLTHTGMPNIWIDLENRTNTHRYTQIHTRTEGPMYCTDAVSLILLKRSFWEERRDYTIKAAQQRFGGASFSKNNTKHSNYLDHLINTLFRMSIQRTQRLWYLWGISEVNIAGLLMPALGIAGSSWSTSWQSICVLQKQMIDYLSSYPRIWETQTTASKAKWQSWTGGDNLRRKRSCQAWNVHQMVGNQRLTNDRFMFKT